MDALEAAVDEFSFNVNDLHRLNRLRFSPRGAVIEHHAGGHRLRRRGDSADFLDYRAYIPGDDLRDIDWNLFGRLRQLIVREHEVSRQLGVHLLIDTSRSMAFGSPRTKLWTAQQLACGLAFIALKQGDRVSVGAFADRLMMHALRLTGVRHFQSVVRRVGEIRPGGGSDLLGALRELRTRRMHRGLTIILSDFLNVADLDRALACIESGGGRLLLVQVLDDGDRGLGLPEGPVRLVDSESGQQVDVRVDAATLEAYRAEFERRRRSLEHRCGSTGRAYLLAQTRDDWLELVCDALRRKAVLR